MDQVGRGGYFFFSFSLTATFILHSCSASDEVLSLLLSKSTSSAVDCMLYTAALAYCIRLRTLDSKEMSLEDIKKGNRAQSKGAKQMTRLATQLLSAANDLEHPVEVFFIPRSKQVVACSCAKVTDDQI